MGRWLGRPAPGSAVQGPTRLDWLAVYAYMNLCIFDVGIHLTLMLKTGMLSAYRSWITSARYQQMTIPGKCVQCACTKQIARLDRGKRPANRAESSAPRAWALITAQSAWVEVSVLTKCSIAIAVQDSSRHRKRAREAVLCATGLPCVFQGCHADRSRSAEKLGKKALAEWLLGFRVGRPTSESRHGITDTEWNTIGQQTRRIRNTWRRVSTCNCWVRGVVWVYPYLHATRPTSRTVNKQQTQKTSNGVFADRRRRVLDT